MTNVIPYIGFWMLLAAVVLGLALYRKFLTAHEEDRYVHLAEAEGKFIPHQLAVNHKIETIDRWGEILTVITLLIGLVFGFTYLYFTVNR